MIDTGSTEVIGTAGWNTCSRCGEQIVGYRTLCDVCRQHPPSCEGQYTMLYPCMNCAIKDNEIANLQAKLAKAEKVVEAVTPIMPEVRIIVDDYLHERLKTDKDRYVEIVSVPYWEKAFNEIDKALADLDTPNPEGEE